MGRKVAAAVAGAALAGAAAWWWWSRRSAGGVVATVNAPREQQGPPIPDGREPASGGVVDTIGRGLEQAAGQVGELAQGFAEGVGNAAGAVADLVLGPRGIRNHNPGNIRRTSDAWQGMAPVQTDAAFVQFLAPEYGIRALAKVLVNYSSRGLRTVRQIIGTWAPPNENDTGAYVAQVARALGVGPDDPIDVRARLPQLVPAIIRHENGQQPYPAEVIAEGIRRALA